MVIFNKILTTSMLRTLESIYYRDHKKIIDICIDTHQVYGSVHGHIKILKYYGLIEKAAIKRDNRSKILVVSEKGRIFLQYVEAIEKMFEEEKSEN